MLKAYLVQPKRGHGVFHGALVNKNLPLFLCLLIIYCQFQGFYRGFREKHPALFYKAPAYLVKKLLQIVIVHECGKYHLASIKMESYECKVV